MYGKNAGSVFGTGGALKDRIDDVTGNLAKRMSERAVISGGNFLSDPERLKKLTMCGVGGAVLGIVLHQYGD